MGAGMGNLLRRLFASERASGGGITPPSTDDDSVLVRLSPGYVSWDGGETWREVPEEEKP